MVKVNIIKSKTFWYQLLSDKMYWDGHSIISGFSQEKASNTWGWTTNTLQNIKVMRDKEKTEDHKGY